MSLTVGEAKIVGDAYRFRVELDRLEFNVVASRAMLDAFDQRQDPRQPAEGITKRLARRVAPHLLKMPNIDLVSEGETVTLCERDIAG